MRSLNPCCNGRGSKTQRRRIYAKLKQIDVLILVVMEEGLRPGDTFMVPEEYGLNPCCNGRGSKTPYRLFVPAEIAGTVVS